MIAKILLLRVREFYYQKHTILNCEVIITQIVIKTYIECTEKTSAFHLSISHLNSFFFYF